MSFLTTRPQKQLKNNELANLNLLAEHSLFSGMKFLPTLCAGSGAKHVHAEEDYFAQAYLFATSSQFTTFQNAAM